ncbi:MAG: sugar phosphate isomerase/epimerase [bacterium]
MNKFKGIAFNTANLVGQVTNWKFELSHWMDQHHATVKAMDEKRWAEICAKIAACGYRAVEVWAAHVEPVERDVAKAMVWKRIMADHGLVPIAYAGGISEDSARVCSWLGIPQTAGGIGGATLAQVTALCKKHGIKHNHENHPEKSAQEILAKIGGGNECVGVAVDTCWLGTQGVNAPEAIRELGSLVRHVHIKDVKAAGGHATCMLGEGCVDVAQVLCALDQTGYTGWLSWEDEPEDRNPFESAVRNREWLEARIA